MDSRFRYVYLSHERQDSTKSEVDTRENEDSDRDEEITSETEDTDNNSEPSNESVNNYLDSVNMTVNLEAAMKLAEEKNLLIGTVEPQVT